MAGGRQRDFGAKVQELKRARLNRSGIRQWMGPFYLGASFLLQIKNIVAHVARMMAISTGRGG
jgi:hypothetical protein